MAFGLSSSQSATYQASGDVLLNDPRSSGGLSDEIGLVLDPGRYTRNQAKVAESPQVAQGASEILGGDPTAKQVQSSVSVSAASNLDALTITATSGTGQGAADLVDAVVASYDTIVGEQIMKQVNQSIDTLAESKASIATKIAEYDTALAEDPDNLTVEAQRSAAVAQFVALDTRIEALATQGALYGSGVQLYVAPETPTAPVSPKPKRNAAIGFVLGAIAAGAFAWWRSENDQRIEDRNAPAQILGAPLLGTVPDFEKVGAAGPAPVVNSPESAAAQAYEFVASSLSFALEEIGGKKVVFTSADVGDGKTVTALNTTLALAQDGRDVLLVDTDERARGLTRLSGYGFAKGLSDVMDGTVSVQDVALEWTIGDAPGLPFVASGSNLDGDTAGYFRSDQFKDTAAQLGADGSLVIIDAPPALAVAETTDIASQADGIVIVVPQGVPASDLHDLKDRLAMSATPIIGYVFNKSTASIDKNRYGYSESG